MIKVAYSSFIDPSDWERVQSSENVELLCGLDWRNPEAFSQTLDQCDLAILRFDAYWNLKMLEETPSEFLKSLLRNSLKTAVWSEDSHHVSHLEAELSPIFNRMYTAHSEYMGNLPEEKVRWIPTSFNSLSIETLQSELQNPYQKPYQRDIIFPFRRYPNALTDRNLLADQIESYCQKNGISTLIGEVAKGKPNQEVETCREILASAGVLNISLREEMNQRFFTALALNKPMLCDKAADMDYVKTDLSSTVFFKRDLSDLGSAIKEFQDLAKGTIQTSQEVITRHMHVHRVVEMINDSLDLNLKVAVPEADWCEIPKTPTAPFTQTAPYQPYRPEDEVPPPPQPKGLKGFLRKIRRTIRPKKEKKVVAPHSPENFRRVVHQFMNLSS